MNSSSEEIRIEETDEVVRVYQPLWASSDPILELAKGATNACGRRFEIGVGKPNRIHVTVELDQAGGAPGVEKLIDVWRCGLRPPFSLAWAPHLRPEPEYRIAAHAFRSPLVLLYDGSFFVALVPDVSNSVCRPWIHDAVLDLDATASPVCRLAYGLEPTIPVDHVYFGRDSDRTVEPREGRICFAYDILVGPAATRAECLRAAVGFIWRKHAPLEMDVVAKQVVGSDRLADVAYETLFRERRFVEFDLQGKPCGGFKAEADHADYFRRPEPVVWNQFWFNGQRTAYGLAHFAEKHHRPEWRRAADRITQTTLAAPSWEGFFPAIFAYGDAEWWGSIPRLNGGKNRVHLADAAATGEWLLLYGLDIDPNPEVLRRCLELGRAALRVQETDGSIPSWFDWDGRQLHANEVLARSAETAVTASYLALLALRMPDPLVQKAARKAADFLGVEVMPQQAYQDFETFFSCSPKPLDFSDPHTGLIPQNSLAVFWTATAMLRVFELSGESAYLDLALEATDLLSLYQQVWSPPFLSLEAFGGFGVMNTDAEWHDARQSLFAPLYFDVHRLTDEPEYLQRGLAALRASFVLACVPEHRLLNPKGYQSYPDGIMPENYGHSGRDLPSGRSDTCWGECGALTTAALIEKYYQEVRL